MTPALLPLDRHLVGIEEATERLATWAGAAGADVPVPTCPDWTVRDLLAHQGMVHRWATAVLRGEDPRAIDTAAAEAEGRLASDQGAWLRAGAADLLATLRAVPDDLDALTFLKDAPRARLFWARRQHHETTVHALDALAARDARLPAAPDAWFDEATALDGIDELLVGFWQRRTSGPRADSAPYSAVVAAASGDRWLLDVGTAGVRTRRLDGGEAVPGSPVAVVSGSAVDLYLALWNRGGAPDDPAGLLASWRGGGAIRW